MATATTRTFDSWDFSRPRRSNRASGWRRGATTTETQAATRRGPERGRAAWTTMAPSVGGGGRGEGGMREVMAR